MTSQQPAPPAKPARYVPGSDFERAVFQCFRVVRDGILARLDSQAKEIAALRASLLALETSAQGHTAQSAIMDGDCPDGQFVDFTGEVIILTYDDGGKPTYKIKGGRYKKFGVRVWDETLPRIGVDAATLKPGPNPFTRRVRALMGEKGPKKVVGLATATEGGQK